jgi:Lar family restriction alleviation protein
MSALALKACPFCGGAAEIVEIEDGENAGGSCVSCTRCQASSNVEFGFKENFVSNWNARIAALQSQAPPSPVEQKEG